MYSMQATRWLLLPMLLTGAFGFAASAPAELLATFEGTAQGTDTGHAYFDSCDVDLVLGDSEAILSFAVALGPTQQPVLFEATAASDPASFPAVAALFTNGQPDEFVIELTGASGGGIGLGTNDCGLFFGDYDCIQGVDMQGGTIDRITLEIRQLSLSPVSNPDGTAIFVDLTMQVFGTPEPDASLLAVAAVAALAVARRRRAVALALLSLAALSSSASAAITLAPGDLVVADQSPPTVYGVDAVSGASKGSCPCSACLSSISDLTVRGTSEIYVSTPNAIVEIIASSCASRVVTSTSVAFGFFNGITLDRNGALLVTADDCIDCVRETFRTYGGVLRVDRSSGAQSIVFSGPPMIGADGLAVAPDGRIYVAAQDTDTVGFDSGVIRIDPSSPAAAAFVAIGDDTAAPIDRTDIISATDIAIENAAGPLYVLDTRYRGSTLQDELRIIAVDLAGVPTSNQTLLTEDLEGVNQDRSSGGLLGIDIAGGALFTLDHVFSSSSSSDWAGIVSFAPGAISGEGTHVTDASAFYYPSGLAVVPERDASVAGMTACLALASLRSRAGRGRTARCQGALGNGR